MKIDNFNVKIVDIPFKRNERFEDGLGVYGAPGSFSTYMILSISTDEGVTGIGEVVADPASSTSGITTKGIEEAVTKHLGPALIGEDPFNLERISERLTKTFLRIGQSNYPYSCINIALYDLMGKILQTPIYNLLGGKYRKQVKLMWCVPFHKPNEIADIIKEKYDAGFKAFKIKCTGNLEEDVARIAAAREAAPKVAIWPDFNELYKPKQAICAIKAMEKYEILCCEQPISVHDLTGMAKVAAAVDTPIAIDEGICDPEDLMKHIMLKAVDMVSLKIEESGGLERARLIAKIAEVNNLPCVLASMGSTGIGAMAGAHLATATKNISYCEMAWLLYHEDDIIDMDKSWYRQIASGFITAPDKPGLGIDLNKEKLEKHKHIMKN